MYLFRSRDRRLMEQTSRDIALTLQRDYRTFNLAETTQLSNRVTIYSGYLSMAPYDYPNISWQDGTTVSSAFLTLEQLLTQLAMGTYQRPTTTDGKNPGIWPVESINWKWIRSLYASINPAYAAWLTANNITVPNWNTDP